MTPLTLRMLHGDCRAVLPTLEANSVQVVVTSPPYFGLRDYGTATWDGGDRACDHKHGGQVPQTKHLAAADTFATGQRPGTDNSHCRKCGARRIDHQIGLEQTPDAYVETLVGVFREVRRVLKDDGVCWLNLGDSYNSGIEPGRNDTRRAIPKSNGTTAKPSQKAALSDRSAKRIESLKPKDLIGIPWRVAFALQADGWWLRQDIIWHKPAAMPESVRDRCTKAHEYLFLLSKRATYYWDADAIKEPVTESSLQRARYALTARDTGFEKDARTGSSFAKTRAGMTMGDAGFVDPDGRNKRSVWTINTQPTPDAHFAVMPEALVEPCILAGSRHGDVVLDPFVGSGTVCRVALGLGRSAIGIDLNADYLEIADRRTNVAPLFTERLA